jgi:hypothetical protein
MNDEKNQIKTHPQLLSKNSDKFFEGKSRMLNLVLAVFFLVLTVLNIRSFYVTTSPMQRAILWGDVKRLKQIVADEPNINQTRIERQGPLAFILSYKDHSVNSLRNQNQEGKDKEIKKRNQVRIAMIEALLSGGV